jgi:hypothetical protein
VREFEEKVAGKCRQWQLLYDLAGWHAAPIIAAAGEWDASHRPPSIEDLLRRPMLSLDPRDDDEEEDDVADEAEDDDRLEDARETAELLEADGVVTRGRYTPEQMARMHRGEPVR